MDDLANFITAVLPGCGLQPIVDVLDNLGVTTVEDLNFVEVDDLGGILKKVECKKLLARARRPSTDTQSSGTERYDGRLDDSCLGSPASSLDLHDGTEMASTSECSISGGKRTAALDYN
ncbi:hypothetical protein KUCAC02_014503 [Chaenocephalus aceratus]|uniref:Uncharacterized protein n=1 Tax=Chaenocephalus aceratus TaxID=36190 RepID=A0ACB9WEN3_CHAAC|nr:hypothetical protein KUCAC02_014503 [Chaenocephalus aceratus]